MGAESDGAESVLSIASRSEPSHVSSDLADPLLALVAQAPLHLPAASPGLGEVIDGKYALERLLGRGGTGVVFHARHLVTDRRLALKWMRPRGDVTLMRQRFVTEARAAGKIRHPNVIDIFDVVQSETATYLVMELLEGESLRARLRRGRLPPAEAIRIATAILDGLSAAHEQGVIHRDLKPENVFLCNEPSGSVKVLDFGICRLCDDGGSLCSELTRLGEFVGTPVYAALERLRERQPFDHRVDIYSMGVILYESLCGELPFVATNLAELAYQLATESPRPLPVSLGEFDRILQPVLERALARAPEDRFADADSFARALRGEITPAVASSSPITGRRRATVLRVTTATAALCAAGALSMLPRAPASSGASTTIAREQHPLPSRRPVPWLPVVAAAAPDHAPALPTAGPVVRSPAPTRSRHITTAAPAAPGELRVVVIPYGQVWVDGVAAGTSPVTTKLSPGSHTVTGGRRESEASASVEIHSGESRQLVLRAEEDRPVSGHGSP